MRPYKSVHVLGVKGSQFNYYDLKVNKVKGSPKYWLLEGKQQDMKRHITL